MSGQFKSARSGRLDRFILGNIKDSLGGQYMYMNTKYEILRYAFSSLWPSCPLALPGISRKPRKRRLPQAMRKSSSVSLSTASRTLLLPLNDGLMRDRDLPLILPPTTTNKNLLVALGRLRLMHTAKPQTIPLPLGLGLP